VVQVSWNDAWAFCDALSVLEGLKPIAHLSARGPWDGVGYRLPTEAEWEYACRAGSTTRHSFGDDQPSLGEFAWYDGNSEAKTHFVGQKTPNAFGLFDMHGNVWEWCWDGYEADCYKKSPAAAADPLGPLQAAGRVYRGGSWVSSRRGCRSASRYGYTPDFRINDLGIRVARVQSGL
jgi:formylglycine-generating enzyme required for sulfatase activity